MNRKFLNAVNLDGEVIIKKGGGVAINNQSKSVEFTENGTSEVKYDAGYTGLEKVSVKVAIPVESKSVTIVENGTSEVAADEGYLNKVSINVAIPTEEKVVDITENGTTEVVAANGFLSKVVVNTNVASSGGGSDFPIIGDGKTYLHIRIVSIYGRDYTLYVDTTQSANSVIVDWGDGTPLVEAAKGGVRSLTHTYDEIGDYVISIVANAGDSYRLGNSTAYSSNCLFGSTSTSDKNYAKVQSLQFVEIGKGVKSVKKSFCSTSIRKIRIPKEVTNVYEAFTSSNIQECYFEDGADYEEIAITSCGNLRLLHFAIYYDRQNNFAEMLYIRRSGISSCNK